MPRNLVIFLFVFGLTSPPGSHPCGHRQRQLDRKCLDWIQIRVSASRISGQFHVVGVSAFCWSDSLHLCSHSTYLQHRALFSEDDDPLKLCREQRVKYMFLNNNFPNDFS